MTTTAATQLLLAPQIAQALQTRWGYCTNPLAAELAGKAGSGRQYFRVHHEHESCIVQTNLLIDDNFHRFIAYSNAFHALQIPVPELYAVDEQEGQCLLQDFGTRQLWNLVVDQPMQQRRWYPQVLSTLTQWQLASETVARQCPDIRQWEFDQKALRWETEYFSEHFLMGHHSWSQAQVASLQEWFTLLAKRVAKHPRGLMHRDFQSQNVMVLPSDQIGLVDFQGARWGSVYYDVASLLLDPYVCLPLDFCRSLFEEWASAHPWLSLRSKDENWSCFLEAGLQRLMQAVGAYCNLSRHKGMTEFADYIEPGCSRLAQVLQLIQDDFQDYPVGDLMATTRLKARCE